MKNISTLETIEAVLSAVREKLTAALTAKTAEIEEVFHDSEAGEIRATLIKIKLNEARILIPTVNEPHYELTLRDFAGGRRLLSDEIDMLASIALNAARRIDALRVIHDRCERELREQEFSKLAAQAELRVLRAQINPHFLFNALTTIGYLINTAPDRAVQTLVQLTGLLRGSLRSSGEFQTLGEELKLIKSYLEIEKARFEERLNVEINIKDDFLSFRVPSLILQPIVENAVKHGISPLKAGGTVSINAWREKQTFILQISDTGKGISKGELLSRRESRVGLNNVEQRLQLHFNCTAKLKIESREGDGTVVRIEFGLNDLQPGKQLQELSPGNARQTEPIFL